MEVKGTMTPQPRSGLSMPRILWRISASKAQVTITRCISAGTLYSAGMSRSFGFSSSAVNPSLTAFWTVGLGTLTKRKAGVVVRWKVQERLVSGAY